MIQRVIVNGAEGRMGRLAAETLQQQDDFEYVAGLGRSGDLASAIQKHQADIVVDFTHADVAVGNTQTILQAGARAVIGTSGFLPKDIEMLTALCESQQLGCIIAQNFSIASNLLMKFAGELVKYYPTVEIVERHHTGKLDSPSGTAVKTAEYIAAQRQADPLTPPKNIEVVKGARGAEHQGIPIHALRLPGSLAHQTVLFGGDGETVTLQHDTLDRASFMPGVVLACRKVTQFNKLIYGFEHLLD